MKKYILGVLNILLFALGSYGQVIPKPNPTAVGIGYKRLLADSTIFIPTGGATPRLGANNINRRSAIYADSVNKKLYVFYPDSSWKEAGTDTISLSNRIDARVKYTDTATMLVPYALSSEIPSVTGFVPYYGANNAIFLGSHGIRTDYTQYSIVPVAVDSVGRLRWSDTDGTLNLMLKGGNVTLQIGQESVRYVHNNTGATLNDGQVVYITGSTGELPSVGLASASSEATSSVTYGVVTEPIAHGSNGFITTYGLVHGLNTNAFIEGSAIWLSDTAGAFRQYPPAKPSHQVLIGYVVKKAGGNGSIDVKIQNGYELDELHNVSITSAANNEGLFYESISGLWKNKSISTVLGYTPANNALVVKYTDTASMLSSYYNKTATDSKLALKANDNAVVHLTGNEVIDGIKWFNGETIHYSPVTLKSTTLNYGTNVLFHSAPFSNYSGATTMVGVTNGIKFGLPSLATTQFSFPAMVGANFTFPATSGTVALTSDIPSLSGYVTGSGTTNYVPAFTGTSAIGNSLIYSNSSFVGIGGTTAGSGKLLVKSSTADNHIQLVGTAPSLRLTNAESATTFNAFIGMSSQVNDYIQTSAIGDMNIGNQTNGSINFGFGSGIATPKWKLLSSGRMLLNGSVDDGSTTLQVAGGGRFAGALTSSRNDAANVNLTLANAYINQGNLINFQQNKAGSTINAYIGHGGDNTGDFFINNGTQAVTIKNDGRVGIGATNVASRFNVKGPNSNSQIEFDNFGTGQNFILSYDRVASAYKDIIITTNASNNSLVVTSAGNTLMGSTTDNGNARLQVSGSASVDGNTYTGGLIGRSYSQTSGGGTGTAIVDAGIYFSSYGQSALYMVSWGGNPNAGGSAGYKLNAVGYISVYTGWSGSAVTTYISYSETAKFSPPNIGTLTLSVAFWNGSSETTSVPVNTSNSQIRIKISGYNSSYTGDSQYVYLTKIN